MGYYPYTAREQTSGATKKCADAYVLLYTKTGASVSQPSNQRQTIPLGQYNIVISQEYQKQEPKEPTHSATILAN